LRNFLNDQGNSAVESRSSMIALSCGPRDLDRCTEPLWDELTHNQKQQKVRILNMTTETEQQRTTEMLDESQVQVHVNKDRAGIFRLILSLRPESWPENISAIEWLSTSIVHDLRNPVAAIYAAAEMLMDPDPAPTQVKRLAANIFRAAGRMRELLADLNSVARGNRPTAEMCDIGEVIAAASEAASAATENHSVQMLLEVPEGIELPLTRSRMERVFFNLIANALEAMPTGGKLRIVARKAGNCVLIELEDTGPGIPRGIRDRLFEPFVTASKPDGLGLRLALSRQTVLTHGGAIWTEPDTGARFIIRLPLNRAGLQ
jgi:signal transduction histidine kinase